MTTVADYLDRTVDVMAFQGVKAGGVSALKQSFTDAPENGRVCTGIQKLAQRWVIEFLTVKGSLRYLPGRGTDFIAELRQGRLRTNLDVRAAFLRAMIDLKRNLQGEETGAEPPDERFDRADLLSVTIRPGGIVVLSVDLYSLAGTSRQVILPLSVTPGA